MAHSNSSRPAQDGTEVGGDFASISTVIRIKDTSTAALERLLAWISGPDRIHTSSFICDILPSRALEDYFLAVVESKDAEQRILGLHILCALGNFGGVKSSMALRNATFRLATDSSLGEELSSALACAWLTHCGISTPVPAGVDLIDVVLGGNKDFSERRLAAVVHMWGMLSSGAWSLNVASPQLEELLSLFVHWIDADVIGGTNHLLGVVVFRLIREMVRQQVCTINAIVGSRSSIVDAARRVVLSRIPVPSATNSIGYLNASVQACALLADLSVDIHKDMYSSLIVDTVNESSSDAAPSSAIRVALLCLANLTSTDIGRASFYAASGVKLSSTLPSLVAALHVMVRKQLQLGASGLGVHAVHILANLCISPDDETWATLSAALPAAAAAASTALTVLCSSQKRKEHHLPLTSPEHDFVGKLLNVVTRGAQLDEAVHCAWRALCALPNEESDFMADHSSRVLAAMQARIKGCCSDAGTVTKALLVMLKSHVVGMTCRDKAAVVKTVYLACLSNMTAATSIDTAVIANTLDAVLVLAQEKDHRVLLLASKEGLLAAFESVSAALTGHALAVATCKMYEVLACLSLPPAAASWSQVEAVVSGEIASSLEASLSAKLCFEAAVTLVANSPSNRAFVRSHGRAGLVASAEKALLSQHKLPCAILLRAASLLRALGLPVAANAFASLGRVEAVAGPGPWFALESLQVIDALAKGPENSRAITEHCDLQAWVGALFDASADGFASRIPERNLVLDILCSVADWDAGTKLSLHSHPESTNAIESYVRRFSLVDQKTFHPATATKVVAFLVKMCAVGSIEVYKWVAETLASAPSMHERNCAVTLLTQCLQYDDIKVVVLKNAAETGLVPVLEAAAGRVTAFGYAPVEACKALTLLQHTASAALVSSLSDAIDGPDANCRMCALTALAQLCELEANKVTIHESLDMTVLERVVTQRNGELDARLWACHGMHRLVHMPCDAALDALVAGASTAGNARINALHCINAIVRQPELRLGLAQPERHIIRTLLEAVRDGSGPVRAAAAAALTWISDNGLVRPLILEPTLDAVAILCAAVTNPDGHDNNSARSGCCQVLWRLGVNVDRAVLAALVTAIGEDTGEARKKTIEGMTCFVGTQMAATSMSDASLGLAVALSALLHSPLSEQDAAVDACRLLANRALGFAPSDASLAALSALLRGSAGADRVLCMDRLEALSTDALRKALAQDSAGIVSALQYVVADEGADDATVRIKALTVLTRLAVAPSKNNVTLLLALLRGSSVTTPSETHNALKCICTIAETASNIPALLAPELDLIGLLRLCVEAGAGVEVRRAACWLLWRLSDSTEVQVSLPAEAKAAVIGAVASLMRTDNLLSGNCRWPYVDIVDNLKGTLEVDIVKGWISLLGADTPYSVTKDVLSNGFAQMLSKDDLKTWTLKNAAETGLVPALEAAAGRVTAFGYAPVEACKALTLLQHTASAALVSSLSDAIDGPDANCRMCALTALAQLCELEANKVAIHESLDMTVLERVVTQRAIEVDSRIMACDVMQSLAHMPCDAALDALVAGASTDGNTKKFSRMCALLCLERLARHSELRLGLAQPERLIVRTLLKAVRQDSVYFRLWAIPILRSICSNGLVKPLILEPTLDAVAILCAAVTNPDGHDNNSARSGCCYVLQMLGVNVDRPVLAALVTAIGEESGESQKNAVEAVFALTGTHSIKLRLLEADLGLSSALEKMLEKNINVEAVGELLRKLGMEPTPGFRASLEKVCREESGASRKAAIGILQMFADSDTSKAQLRAASSGCLEAMQFVIRDDAAANDSRSLACRVLSALDLAPNAATMKSIVESISSPNTKVQIEALTCIANLAASHSIKVAALQDASVAAALNVAARGGQGDIQQCACSAIGLTAPYLDAGLLQRLDAQIAGDDPSIALNATFSLLKLLQSVPAVRKMAASRDPVHARVKQTLQTCLARKLEADEFDEAAHNVLHVLGKLGLLPLLPTLSKLVGLLSEGIPSMKGKILNGLTDCLYGANQFHHKLGSGRSHFGLAAAILEISKDKSSGRVGQAWQLLMNMAADRSSVTGMLAAGVHTEALQHLQETRGDAPSMQKYASGSSIYSYTVLAVMNLVEWPEAREDFREAGAVAFFKLCYLHESCIGLYSSVILAFLVGNDETTGGDSALLQSSPATIARIIDCLACTANRVGGEGYSYGIFTLKQILKAVQNICVSDANKRQFANTRVVNVLVQVISDFNANKVGGSAGGGGEDVESAEACVEILLLLSFVYKDDGELRGLMSPESGVVEALEMFQLKTSGEFAISKDAERTSRRLLSCLCKPREVEVSPLNRRLRPADQGGAAAVGGGCSQYQPVAPSRVLPKHVMLSYCWADKPNVKKLCAELRRLGHDVWRDEEGSSILGPMAVDPDDGVDDCMAAAVEMSSHVIICVSKNYKESGNCRFEAKYAFDLLMKRKLKVLYCMMDENYAKAGDTGWLAGQMARMLWYPLWSESVVATTSARLSAVIKPSSMLQQGVAASPRSPALDARSADDDDERDSIRLPAIVLSSRPASASQQQQSLPQPSLPSIVPDNNGSHHQQAWALLCDPFFATDAAALQSALTDLGVGSSEGLALLEHEEIVQISSLLKPVPQRRFIDLVKSR